MHYIGSQHRLGIARERLAAILDEELAARPPGDLGGPLDADVFTLSFDDAHRSLLDVVELLRTRGVRPTLFVPTAYVDTSDDFLRWDDLRFLRDQGWIIGSHSVSHPRMRWRLYDEDDAAQRRRLVDECLRSRATLERELGIEISLFAYPFGEDGPAAKAAVRAAGYTRAFTVRPSMEWDGDLLSIPRIDAAPPEPRRSSPIGISVVVPAYERAEILAEVVTRLASQSYPEDAYEVLVVDDGSESELRPIFAEMPANVRLLQPKGVDATFRAGQARQYGASRARFETLAFLDADVAVGPDFLWHLDWVHRHEDDAVVLGYLSGYNLHDLGYVHTLDAVRGADLDALPVIPDRSREPALRRCLDNLEWLGSPWELCYTGNLSLPKALLDRVGGFAADFDGWGLEDVDLGYRLHAAGARWVLSRWALGFHLVDPSEPVPRNPFRKLGPRREDFAGFLANAARLQERHPDPAVQAFVARVRSDVAETCASPSTVGIEFGGQARFRGPHHRRLHRIQPGGVPPHELLDRVAYAAKVGARSIYLLGGEPAEHPALPQVLEAAKATVPWVAMQTLVYPFAEQGLARALHRAGLDGVDAVFWSTDPQAHTRASGFRWELFAKGWRELNDSGLEVNARLIVTPETVGSLAATLKALAGVTITEISVTDERLTDAVHALGYEPTAL